MNTAINPLSAEIQGNLAQPVHKDNSPFRNFAIVWAVATLFHMAHSGVFDTRLNFALLTIAALYVLFKPSLGGFLALILLQLLDVAIQMPNATNHWVFTGFVNLTILQSVLYCIYKKKSFQVDEMEVFQTFAPVARIEVLILYGWAILHKLNAGFFSPEVSCATTLLEAQHLDRIIRIFPQIVTFNPYFTILIELAILVMLFIRRTRNIGIITGLFFHLVLSYSSYNAFFDFTSTVLAAYFLFTHHDFNRRADQWRKSTRQELKSFFNRFSFPKLLGVCLTVALLLGAITILNKKLYTFDRFHLHFFWTLYAVALSYVLVRFLFVKRQPDEQKAFALKTKWFLILPVIVFLNGASPYLGLKTDNSFSMFSNLRTEGGVTNHYIIPVSTQIFGYQTDLIEIISSTDEKLQRFADEHQLMVLFEFKKYLQKRDVEEVRYRLKGNLEVYRKGETEMTGHLKRDSFLLLQLMKFRNVSKFEPEPCAH